MNLHFDRAAVNKLLEHTRAAKTHSALYEDPKTAKPGLWLVGDDGVYLMSNGEPRLPGEDDKNFVVYADEVNPKTMAFDEWWGNKQLSFGGDDGVDFLALSELDKALATYQPDAKLIIDVTQGSLAIIYYTRRKPKPRAPK
jgi:hypothetical protein